jgi:hypothetical protein
MFTGRHRIDPDQPHRLLLSCWSIQLRVSLDPIRA